MGICVPTAAAWARAERLDGDENAGITIWRHGALQAARQAERDIANGDYRGPRHGVPMALEGLLRDARQVVTNGSMIDANSGPDDDATVVALKCRLIFLSVSPHGRGVQGAHENRV